MSEIEEFKMKVYRAIAEDEDPYEAGDLSERDIDRLAEIAAAAYEEMALPKKPYSELFTDGDYSRPAPAGKSEKE